MAKRRTPTEVAPEPIYVNGFEIRPSGYWWYVLRDGQHVKRPSSLDPTYMGNVLYGTKEQAVAFARDEVV